MTVTSGAYFPTIPYQAARAVSLTLDYSGSIALSAIGQGITSGVPTFVTGVPENYYSGPTLVPYGTSGVVPYTDEWVVYAANGAMAYTPGTSGIWFVEPPGRVGISTPMAVLPGYTLDASSGLLAWGGDLLVSGSPPYTSMYSGSSGIYITTLTDLYTSGGTQVSGVMTSGVFASMASGVLTWLLGNDNAYQISFVNPTSGSALDTPIPFTATCMAASGSSLVVAGEGNLNLGSGGYTLAVGVSGTAIVCFPGSGLAITWLLTGDPVQQWTHLATSSGLPTYSSGISVVWPSTGNTLVLSDYGLGNWTSYLYTGGVLTFQTSGSVAGSARGIAVTTNGQYVGIPNPGSSGVYIIESTGATWSGLGIVAAGQFPDCGAIAAINPTTFTVGSSGQVALLSYMNSGWVSGSPIPLQMTPSAAYYDSSLGQVLWAANSGTFASTQWLPLSYGLVSSGIWSSTSGMVVGLASQRSQALVLTSNSYNMVGPGPNGNSINYWSQPATGLTDLGIPTPADYTFPILSLTNGLEFQNLTGPYSIDPLRTGMWGTIASGGAPLTNLTMLGQGILPSALGYSYDGTLLLATTRGALGPLSSGSAGLSYMLASGGFSDMLVASGQTWLSTTVQGSLVSVSGL